MSGIEAWFIYGLREIGTTTVRYVGFTRSPRNRLNQHLSVARCNKKRRRVYDWIRSVWAAESTIEMIILESGSGPRWKEAECRWISEFAGNSLFNMSAGGGSPAIPPESRARAGDKLKTRIFTAEHRARISEANRGRKRPDLADRNRSRMGIPTGPMNISDEERARRSRVGKLIGMRAAELVWGKMTPECRAEYSSRASEQMKKIWAQRKSQHG